MRIRSLSFYVGLFRSSGFLLLSVGLFYLKVGLFCCFLIRRHIGCVMGLFPLSGFLSLQWVSFTFSGSLLLESGRV